VPTYNMVSILVAPPNMLRNPGHDEWRDHQAASSDEFVAIDEMYKGLHNQTQDENTPTIICAKYYVDYTISLAVNTEDKEELKNFVAFFGGDPVKQHTRTITMRRPNEICRDCLGAAEGSDQKSI
jgi:hypothetical protein